MNEQMNVAVVSNISIDPFIHQIQASKTESSEIVNFYSIPYQQYAEERYQPIIKKVDVIIVWLNLEFMVPKLHNGDTAYRYSSEEKDNIINVLENLRNYLQCMSKGKLFWILFEDLFLHDSVVIGQIGSPLIRSLNQSLQETMNDHTTYIDLQRIISTMGKARAFSVKNKFRWGFPYSLELVKCLIEEIQKRYFIENGVSKKCLVLDCDNVLWGGILSEDGIERIKLSASGNGYEYQEFQRFVLSLYYRGVILAVCSKNDMEDVLRVFREHSGMILKEEHIACFQVNWGNKPDNIRQIADQLNIGLESMVFIDDSCIEIEGVRSMLPEVTAIQYNRESMYDGFSCFNLKAYPNHDENIKRSTTYKTNIYRNQLKAQYSNFDDYLAALEMKLDIHEAMPSELSRIVELTQRTNKCTNGWRCTEEEIQGWSTNKAYHLYSVYLSDKFSDLGLVGALCVYNNSLLMYSLSCRALGRKIESYLLRFLKEQHLIKDFTFQSTGKNQEVEQLIKNILLL